MINNELVFKSTLFSYVSSTKSGGVILVSNDFTSLKVSSTVFSFCSIPNVGGNYGTCINYNSKYQSFVGRKIPRCPITFSKCKVNFTL